MKVYTSFSLFSSQRGALPIFLLVLALYSTRLVNADEEIGLCCLCNGCQRPIRSRKDLTVDMKGTTCDALALEMADPTNGSKAGNGKCRRLKTLHHDRCCNPNHVPIPIDSGPTPAPGSEYGYGTEPTCELCHPVKGKPSKYPEKPFTTVAVLQLPDANTCKDLYWMGQNGLVPDALCNPMQDYYDGFCGCYTRGVNNVGNNGGTSDENGGGAPDKQEPSSTLSPTNDPPRKDTGLGGSDEDKDKLYDEEDRGNLDRRRRKLKGRNLRGR